MRAVLYVRVSTIEQAIEGYSISAQTSILKDFAKAYNYNVIKVYQDAGISGKNISARPAMSELIKDAKLKKFDIVLVWKLSRLSRSLLDLLEVVDIFNQNGIVFQSFSEKFDTSTPMGKMLLQMLGSIAEFERNTIAENVKMGLNERFKQGYSKGAIPFGYISENKKAVISPEQAETVRYLFDKYIQTGGNCLTELAEELNTIGHRTRAGSLWDRNLVKDLLRNCFYAGYVKTGFTSHGRKLHEEAAIIKGQHEPIIDKDTFNKANALIDNSKRLGIIKNTDSEATLTGLLICPFCGSKLYSYNSKQTPYINKNGETKIYDVYAYRCVNRGFGNGVCKGVQISYKKIDPFVVDAIDYYVNNKKYLVSAKKSESAPNKDNGISQIEKELKKQKTLKDKYFKAFEMSNLPDLTPFMDKINVIYSNIQELENKKIELMRNEKVSSVNDFRLLFDKVTDFKEMYYNLSNPNKKELMRKIIKKISLSVDKKVVSIELINTDNIDLLP